MNVELHEGDCLEILRTLPDASVDALVTDPPAGIEFMGKAWDSFKRGRLAGYTKPPGGLVERQAERDFSGRMGSHPNITQRASVKCIKCGRYKWGHTTGDGGGGGKKCECANPQWAIDTSTRETFVAFMTAVMAECLRVLKPGGHALVWAIPRTSHWTATAIEDAGFEVRDVITHHYGSGFPKSLDVSKAIDKAAGAEREVVGQRVDEHFRPAKGHESRLPGGAFKWAGRIYQWEDLPPKAQEYYERAAIEKANITAPATDEAKRWEGWGTALKPASEHWILARKPLAEPNVASQVLATGTGAINVDGCRVAHNEELKPMRAQSKVNSIIQQSGRYEDTTELKASGRWPANLVLSHAPGCREVGVRKVGAGDRRAAKPGQQPFTTERGWNQHSMTRDGATAPENYGEEEVAAWECVEGCPVSQLGTESRFFYTAKASATERSAGLSSRNTHPTVKPVELMRWLCRLITPPGGTILDCFCGSGSTGVAAKLEGFSFIGIDQDPESVEIARRRLDWAVHEPTLFDLEGGEG